MGKQFMVRAVQSVIDNSLDNHVYELSVFKSEGTEREYDASIRKTSIDDLSTSFNPRFVYDGDGNNFPHYNIYSTPEHALMYLYQNPEFGFQGNRDAIHQVSFENMTKEEAENSFYMLGAMNAMAMDRKNAAEMGAANVAPPPDMLKETLRKAAVLEQKESSMESESPSY